ncbi:MAG TPA: FAD-dependent oxidoreductase, partial [Syntrophobacteria bacterium]|nr:FAD-dependent oxidoreductase [Syntrophobacteria bacterium]
MGETERYDVIIVGAGPGGYVAAVRAAQLGLKTACIEKMPRVGGVCLNVGCIPSKALLDSSEYYHLAREHFAEHGIRTGKLKLDLAAMMARKEQVVHELTDNVRKLLDGNHVAVIGGVARLAGPDRVEVTDGSGGGQIIEAKAILLATGSEPVAPPGLAFDGERIVSSTEALSFQEVPQHLGIVGGGYIGLEVGSVWLRLGARVTVVEMLPQIATLLDGQVARGLERILTRQGLTFRLLTKVRGAEVSGNGLHVSLESEGREESLECDRLLVAVGRRP